MTLFEKISIVGKQKKWHCFQIFPMNTADLLRFAAIVILSFSLLFPDDHNDLLGDLNQDGEVNVLDVVRIVNIILEEAPAPTDYELWAADVNADENVNVLDVVTLVNFVLGVQHELCTEEFYDLCYYNYSECCLELSNHIIDWEFYYFGTDDHLNYLNDIEILNENEFWAVGYISIEDSTSWPGYLGHNTLHWIDGEFEITRTPIPVNTQDGVIVGETGSAPIERLAVFAADDIWFSASAYSLVNWDGENYNHIFYWDEYSTSSFAKTLYGISSSFLFSSGAANDFYFWDGVTIERMYNPISPVTDMWGLDENHVWEAKKLAEYGHSEVGFFDGTQWSLKYNASNWGEQLQPPNADISSMSAVWAYEDTFYIACNEGLWKESISTGEGILDNDEAPQIAHYGESQSLRGNHYNDILTMDAVLRYAHYNGDDWLFDGSLYDTYNWMMMDMMGDLIVVVGHSYSNLYMQAVVVIGHRVEELE